LLERARTQDPQAWHRLVGLYAPLVYGWCRRAGLREDDALDVGQEVFKRVFGKLGDFQRAAVAHPFRGWLRTITRNCIADHYRTHPPALAAAGGDQALRALQQLAADGDEPAGAGRAGEVKDLLGRALRQLEPEFSATNWRAFWRVTVDQQPAAEVARELGISVNSVYLAKSRILSRFREEFAGLLEEA
jgi:RNA polymerase sigma-70 factor (ECF subfamily)